MIEKADIHTEIFGSDHCPVELVVKSEERRVKSEE